MNARIFKILGAAGLFGLLPMTAHAALPGAELSGLWALPFAGILLSIALGPLLVPHFWHNNYGKIALCWALLCAIPLYIVFDAKTSTEAVAHAMIGDYFPFIIFVGALYTVAGGIHLRGSFVGTPALNTIFLAVGAVLANFMGTTGAAMLLIRPMIDANRNRHFQMHTYIFFIFIVANIAGSLTPLGDPPLFLGFLRGVTFFWTAAHLWFVTGLAVGLLLIIYYSIDSILLNMENRRGARHQQKFEEDQEENPPPYVPFGIEGSINFFWLACIIGAVLMSGFWQSGIHFEVLGVHMTLESELRDLIFILASVGSVLTTPKACRIANQFTWEPILEVAKLFFGIFGTIVPVLDMLRAGTKGAFAPVIALVSDVNGNPVNAAYFWLTGVLSSFLDNAPTYLSFFNLAGGDAEYLMNTGSHTLMAISMGAVFMGSLTYIGNAPNFMVLSIVQERGIKMPTFFGYMAWSYGILIPLFLVLTWLSLI